MFTLAVQNCGWHERARRWVRFRATATPRLAAPRAGPTGLASRRTAARPRLRCRRTERAQLELQPADYWAKVCFLAVILAPGCYHAVSASFPLPVFMGEIDVRSWAYLRSCTAAGFFFFFWGVALLLVTLEPFGFFFVSFEEMDWEIWIRILRI